MYIIYNIYIYSIYTKGQYLVSKYISLQQYLNQMQRLRLSAGQQYLSKTIHKVRVDLTVL